MAKHANNAIMKSTNTTQEDVMKELRCSKCSILLPEEELLVREDNGELECPECAGFYKEEDLCCDYDEIG